MPTVEEWLVARRYLGEHRHVLALEAAGEYPSVPKVAGTPLLTAPEWMPAVPIPLDDLSLELRDVRGGLPEGFGDYSKVMAEFAAPAVFENRPTFRLLDFTDRHLTFGMGSYFDGIDVGEACAHEYAARSLGQVGSLPLRAGIGNPCDLTARPANVAVSTLTIRHDRATGDATFFLHWRDPKRVGHAGGLYQVLPVGVFQDDFSLWRCMIREFAEELLGVPDGAPIDPEFAARLTSAARVSYLGMGVDPLTFATDMLTVAVIEAARFDELFGDLVAHNDEGRVLEGLPFTAANIERFVHHEPTQAAGAALLALAWEHREILLRV